MAKLRRSRIHRGWRSSWVAAALAAAGALLLLEPRSSEAFQGMAAPKRMARPAPKIQSSLPPVRVNFTDIAEQAGLQAVIVSGSNTQKKYILEATGTGVVLFDFDNDGLTDIFLVNATTLDAPAEGGPASHLYRNLGGLKFEDVTGKAGLGKSGWGQGGCAADFDNDGNRDLFVTYYGHSVLYRNEGKGVFRDYTEQAGLQSAGTRWDTGCSFFDYDLDGRLDLAVSGYIDFDLKTAPQPGKDGFCQWKGLPVMCGPRGLKPGRNLLFHNEGDGRFRDVSKASGVGAPAGCYGFTMAASDFDDDGKPDLYVACDSTASLMYHNLGNGSFEEIGIATGAALNDDGQEQAGMGVGVADYDEDGHIDMVKTNFSDDTPNLYHNNGDGTFSDLVYPSGLGVYSQYLGWGAHFLDFDNDGRRDILLVNGHVYPEIDGINTSERFRQPRLLFRNVGGGKFLDMSGEAGDGILATHSSRGSAVGDLDNDGSLEVVVMNQGERPSLLKNSGDHQNWLLVRCTGTTANRDAIGARAYLYAGSRRLSAEVQTGSGFLSQNDNRLHFGLGADQKYDRIEVQWPGGSRETFPGGKANQIVELRQGGGSVLKTRSSGAESKEQGARSASSGQP